MLAERLIVFITKIIIINININNNVQLLTNHLKEIISYRQLNVMDETYVMNQVKEDALFVSLDFNSDMKKAKDKDLKRDIVCDYVLPDFSTISRGYTLPNDSENRKQIMENHQMIRLNHERFTVPEILFHPSDIGLSQKGIPEAVLSCIESCSIENPSTFVENIILTGGNCLFPNFSNRLFNEIRSLTPDFWDVNIFQTKKYVTIFINFISVFKFINFSPETFAFEGAAALATKHPEIVKKRSISKRNYDEYGSNAYLDSKTFKLWSTFN